MRNLSILLVLIALASLFGGSAYLERLYATHRPSSADVVSGYVYEHHVRGGSVVFISRSDSWALSGTIYGGLLLGIFGAFMLERSKRRGGNSAA
jgi:hypothetical protein